MWGCRFPPALRPFETGCGSACTPSHLDAIAPLLLVGATELLSSTLQHAAI